MSQEQADYITDKYDVRKRVYEKTKGYCWYCGVALIIDAKAGRRNHSINPKSFTVDHFIPKNNGGSDDEKNLVPSCSWCNRQKYDKDIEIFRERITRLQNHIPKFTDEQLFYFKEQD